MLNRIQTPLPINEPIRSYLPGSLERKEVKAALAELSSTEIEIPLLIGGREVKTGRTRSCVIPHDHGHVLAHFHLAGRAEAEQAVDAAMAARDAWSRLPWRARAGVFLKAADLLAGPWRARVNAATMLCQSKTVFQAEIDAACELIDFWRFNVHFAQQLYSEQPISPPGQWNQVEYRPLEGFVYAVTPFNFTSIGGNLPTAPALMGNVAIWKPAATAVYSNWMLMQLLREAGLPDGVINFLPGDPAEVSGALLGHRSLAGVHFTGSTEVFQSIWKTVGEKISSYATYPRLVGETGGKDFVLVHPSADAPAVAANLVRGAFEFQGQKCSAASRAYLPASLWPTVRDSMGEMLGRIKMGDTAKFSNFVGAVIDKRAFDKITAYIAAAKASPDVDVVFGGGSDGHKGYFIEPTVLLTRDPRSTTMCEEIFGPVLSIFVYNDADFEQTMDILDSTSPYALTGAVFAQDRAVIEHVRERLRDNAGNFYINDKPTGAVVGQQPFGGARASGTNDKAGSILNLVRWVSARTVKETFVPPTDFHYPFMLED